MTKSIKKSVRLNATTQAVCANVSVYPETNWSGSLNDIAEQFLLLIEDNTPELTENEWNAFRCLYNGYMSNPDIETELKLLPWHVSEGLKYDEQVRQFIADDTLAGPEQCQAFFDKVNSWNKAQRIAVIYKAKEFWNKGKPLAGDFEE